MAKFLTTTGCLHYIEEIIRNASKSLVLVTPFLRLDQNFDNRLHEADERGVKITLIYGKSDLSPIEAKKLNTLQNLDLFYCDNLHAKCYYNENQLLISSMNLYEASKNSREIGIYIEKQNDTIIFQETLKEVESILKSSNLENGIKNSIKTILPSANMENIDYEINSQYNGIANFHLPALFQMLKQNLPTKEIILDDRSIRIADFPKIGISVIIDNRIDFRFQETPDFDKIKNRKEIELQRLFKNLRIYWNYYVINIYTNSDYEVSLNNKGLEEKANKYFNIVTKIGHFFA